MFERNGLAAVCTSLDKAIEMLKDWHKDELEDKSKFEKISDTLEINGEYSYAEIRNESGAWIQLEVEAAWTNDWLNM